MLRSSNFLVPILIHIISFYSIIQTLCESEWDYIETKFELYARFHVKFSYTGKPRYISSFYLR